MQIKDIMTSNAVTIDSNASVVEAARKMKSLEIGALPVRQGEELVGMITDRDITVRCVAEKKDISKTQVGDIMTPEVFYCQENDDIQDAARTMEEKCIHRLLVLDKDYEPVGFVSLADLAVKGHDEHLIYEVVERISEPACPHK